MVDYTKYELKSSEELTALLTGKDNLFLVACNKCFKEFDTVQEPEVEPLWAKPSPVLPRSASCATRCRPRRSWLL